MAFVRNDRYYSTTVYEWNLPTGFSCPYAKECKVTVHRFTGQFTFAQGQYRCYAANAERFPSVRNHRWGNFSSSADGIIPPLPASALFVRIHASGDFFSQEYFDLWLNYCRAYPHVSFWAYTKSLPFWVARLHSIPNNLILTASHGGKADHLIQDYYLKNVMVYPDRASVPPNRPIDTNDDYARLPLIDFALVDNFNRNSLPV